jgi:hypothetical protein
LPYFVYDVSHDYFYVVFEYRQIGNQLPLELLYSVFLVLSNDVLIGEPLFLQKESLEKRVYFVKGTIAIYFLQHVLYAGVRVDFLREEVFSFHLFVFRFHRRFIFYNLI